MFNQMGGSKTDTIVKLVLVCFISLLSFSVGTFVGKQVSDSDYRKAALEGDYEKSRETASVDEKEKSKQQEEGLTEDDVASLTEEFVESEKEELKQNEKDSQKEETKSSKAHSGKAGYNKHQQSKKQKSGEKGHKNKEQQAKSSQPSKAAKRVAKGQAPAEGEKEQKDKRKPSSILPSAASSAVGKYTVQVASYPQEGEAKSHASKLKNKGWNAFYVPAQVKGQTWYRVSVGLFKSQKNAMNFRSDLMKEAEVSEAFIQKIVQ